MADSQQEKEENLKSMSDAVKVVIDGYPAGHEFYGNELKEDVVKIYPGAINMYPDTVLKMARRHRRKSYISIDRNNSLYKKIAVKSIVEQIKELAPKETPAEQPESDPAQGLLFVLAVFLVFGFEAVFALESAFGRPLIPLSFMASKSASVYNPVGPMYLKGVLPYLCNLRFTASDDTFVPNLSTISSIVIPSMPSSIYGKTTGLKGENGKMFRNRHILLHSRIVKNRKICNFLKISRPTLDYPLGRGYIVIMFRYWNIKKRLPEAPVAKRHLFGAKGDFYERRTEKFSGMA